MSTLKLGLYQHYKGNYYQVIGLSRHTETEEPLVIYQSLYGDFGLWARPLAMFTEDITLNHQVIPRFKFIKELFNSLSKSRDN